MQCATGRGKLHSFGMETRNKLIFYCAAWAIALWATSPNLELITVLYLFPLGLAAFVYPPWSEAGWGAVAFGTAIYVVHGVLFFRAKRRKAMTLLALSLVALLICNVASCRGMVRSL